MLAAGQSDAAPISKAFEPVDRATRASFEKQHLSGMGLSVYDAHGDKVFEQMYGVFSPDQRMPIASASKLIAGLTILRLVDQGRLSLDSTTGQVLGWKGPQAAITLKHLLSFTSGLPPYAPCILRPGISFADCAQSISQLELTAPPGTRFEYGSTHLHAAARMAEVVSGRSWNEVFAAELREPLGIGALTFYTWPRKSWDTANPFIAAGLRMTMNEYARVLELEYHRGVYRGKRLISDELFTAQATEPYPDAIIGNSPAARMGLKYRYGLASWLECPPPAVDCPVQSSPGIFGFTPWVDRPGGYYAILGMDVDSVGHEGAANFSVELAQELRPMIREAVAAKAAVRE